MALPTVWQVLLDGYNWTDITPAANTTVEQDFNQRRPTSSYVLPYTGTRFPTGTPITYTLDFNEMVQINSSTGFERPARRYCHVPNPSEVWQWQSDYGWQDFESWVSELIRLMRIRGDTEVVVHIGTVNGVQSYDIDLMQNVQTNHDTQFTRAIRMSSGAQRTAAAAPGQYGGSGGDFAAELQGAEDCTDRTTDDDTCPLCFEAFQSDEEGMAAIRLRNCQGHYMHKECIIECFTRMGPRCPTCSHMYGVLKGNQPNNGTMTVQTIPPGQMACVGFNGTGTLVITYQFPSGVQGPNHPSPGSPYSGTVRQAYLPDTPAGQEVLALLRRAFDNRLIFTVGTSVTTGRPNCVVWNGVHHKTNLAGGAAAFGYPDPTYFDRVKAELAQKGIKP